MKVLAISSSARKGGNTALLVEEAFEELHREGIETELIELAGQVIEPCKACWACGGRMNCVHRRDSFREIFEKMKEADGLLLATPVYAANMSANMQALLERAAVISDMNGGLFRHKVGAALCAARRGGAVSALDGMNRFFLSKGMYAVGASYWPLAYGTAPGDVREDAEGLETMRALGQNMAWLLRAVEGRAAG